MDRSDLANLTAFVAIAEQRSFRAAASRLHVTPLALSHLMKQLEERVGVRLLHRTTRSVSVTDAGQRLLEELRPAIDRIAAALEDLDGERLRPLGRLRLHAINDVAAMVTVAPVWGVSCRLIRKITLWACDPRFAEAGAGSTAGALAYAPSARDMPFTNTLSLEPTPKLW